MTRKIAMKDADGFRIGQTTISATGINHPSFTISFLSHFHLSSFRTAWIYLYNQFVLILILISNAIFVWFFSFVFVYEFIFMLNIFILIFQLRNICGFNFYGNRWRWLCRAMCNCVWYMYVWCISRHFSKVSAAFQFILLVSFDSDLYIFGRLIAK